MVLQGQPCGRVGRCRGFEGSLARVGLLSFSVLACRRIDELAPRAGPGRAPIGTAPTRAPCADPRDDATRARDHATPRSRDWPIE